MAKPRSKLSEILHEICDEVHFQPPTGFKLKYPCIIYELERMNVRRADNAAYTLYDEYLITYITRDPDDSTKLKSWIFHYALRSDFSSMTIYITTRLSSIGRA